MALAPLFELALDLRWTWSHSADALWRQLDAERWALTRNPWHLLHDLPPERLEAAVRDPKLQEALDAVTTARARDQSQPCWCDVAFPGAMPTRIAYFSMEFGLAEALPLYAGGLGILAGDVLKGASDLGLPLVGLGLLYQEGYFRQIIDAANDQIEFYPYNEPASLPITPARDRSGGRLQVSLQFPGRTLRLRVWHAKIGRVPLYLLDSNDPVNTPADRGITAKLYGGGTEARLMQEIVLGVGGWRALEALELAPEVCHLNEGHAAFATLERVRQFMRSTDASFQEAVVATRAGNVFTTHTPVDAGFDRFEVALIRKYFPLVRDYGAELGLSADELLALGRADPQATEEPFNMAYLALRMCRFANGVSRRHGEISRQIFQPLFRRWPERNVPIAHVTNGVHVPSWDSAWSDRLWTAACGKGRWRRDIGGLQDSIERLNDEELWAFRTKERRDLVAYARARHARAMAASGRTPEVVARAAEVLDPDALTLGFARRFTAYKRPDLLLKDPERLARLLRRPEHPVQILIAGKAHPADWNGKRLIRDWVKFVERADVRGRAIFLEDYDIALAQQLVQGIDVWLNTPRPPLEASGTSGMKVLVNGGLNLSELDGWWAEAYAPEVGWAIAADERMAADAADAAEADALYRILEDDIVPLFYARDSSGLPRQWIARVRASMARLAPRFSTNRMLGDYLAEAYIPCAQEYRRRSADNGRLAKAIGAWEVRLRRLWPDVRFGDIAAERLPDKLRFEVGVHLAGAEPADVRVELYADPSGNEDEIVAEMTRVESAGAPPGWFLYAATVRTHRPAEHFTPRVLPAFQGVRIPLELPLIAWAR